MPNIYQDRKVEVIDKNDKADKSDHILEAALRTIKNKESKFGLSSDIEKTKDELIKFKQTYNNKVKEMNILKQEFNKLKVTKIINKNRTNKVKP